MKTILALLFGGRSTEHEISVITAMQAYKNLDKEKYEIIPIYQSKKGDFYTNSKFLDIQNYKDIEKLLLSSKKIVFTTDNNTGGLLILGILPKFKPLNVAFPIFHGSFGEDGSIQGLLEQYRIPYVGFDVGGSSIGMDKLTSKLIFQSLGLPIGKYFSFKRFEWQKNKDEILKNVKSELRFPMFVKPASVGSSIGINKATDDDSLAFAIEVALIYSNKAIVEEAFENVVEVNCSAMGYKEVRVSVCEMPIVSSNILSFEDKYKKGSKGVKNQGMASASRIIPAPISNDLTKKIQEMTIRIFKSLDGCGVARVDYFVDKKNKKIWVNEINTIPGSLSFYLWDKSGISFTKLLDKLIEFALERYRDKMKTQYTFESGLLSQIARTKRS